MKKQRASAPLCPLRGARCLPDCAWNTSGGCAVAVLAVQASRQANELYAVAEIMNGGHVEPADTPPPEGAESG